VYSLSPKVYDIAFSFRDFEAEVAFIVEAHAKLSSQPSSISSFLEVGCGPARHAMLLAQCGIPRRSVGIDLSPEMIEYARQRAAEQGLEGRMGFVVADMASAKGFKGSVVSGDELFDAAAIMLGTFSHCLDNDSAVATLKNVGECVKPGGILVIELGSPRDIYQGAFCMGGFLNVWEIGESGDVDFGDEEYEEYEEYDDDGDDDQQVAREDIEDIEDIGDVEELQPEMRVMVEYGREGDRFDVERGVLWRTTGFSLFDTDGELVSSSVSVVEQRQFTLQELDLLARLSGWRLLPEGVFGDFDLDVSVHDEHADRMIAVFRRE
jgi:SAM-dependent methyltransferase